MAGTRHRADHQSRLDWWRRQIQRRQMTHSTIADFWTQVVPGSAADVAGLHVGDVGTALDGEPVSDILDMTRIIRGKRLGDKVSVDFTRGGAPQRIEEVLKPLGEPIPQRLD